MAGESAIIPDDKNWTWVLERACPECGFDASTFPATAVAAQVWGRTGIRSDGAAFTVDTFARYFLHDPVHHLWDVTGEPADVH